MQITLVEMSYSSLQHLYSRNARAGLGEGCQIRRDPRRTTGRCLVDMIGTENHYANQFPSPPAFRSSSYEKPNFVVNNEIDSFLCLGGRPARCLTQMKVAPRAKTGSDRGGRVMTKVAQNERLERDAQDVDDG